MREDVLYESVKRFVKMRKEDLNAFFTASLRNRKFKISCCDIAKRIETSPKLVKQTLNEFCLHSVYPSTLPNA